jgi:cell division transport system ATP-binding protein
VIQLFHVTKAYPGDPPALVDVSLQIAKGEFVFLTGASGAGKSTLLRMLFGAALPTGGQVMVAGQNIARLGRADIAQLRRRIGVVFQDFKLLQNRSVFDNVAVTLEVLGTEPREIRRKVTTLLRYVGLLEKADALPSRLSGGEQQRVAIARALAGDPAILLADEPTGNLDQERAQDILDLLTQVNARGTTVVVATHDRQLLARYARRVVMLDRGRVTADGVLESSQG